MKALNLMKVRKAARLSGVTFELLNVCKIESKKNLAEVADDLLQQQEMTESRRNSNLIPFIKKEMQDYVKTREA